MDLEEIGISTRNRVDPAQDRDYWRSLVISVLNLLVPQAMELVSKNSVTYRAETRKFNKNVKSNPISMNLSCRYSYVHTFICVLPTEFYPKF